jgi:hypothetical protein
MQQRVLIAARKAAEAAVAEMADGALKTAAFQTILTQLLQNESARFSPASVRGPQIKPSVRKKNGSVAEGTTGRLISLIDEGIFGQQRSLAEIRRLLSERGWHYRLEDLGTPFTRLVRRRLLRRVQAAEGGKKIWKYSNY